jgi:hypothetical protein
LQSDEVSTSLGWARDASDGRSDGMARALTEVLGDIERFDPGPDEKWHVETEPALVP